MKRIFQIVAILLAVGALVQTVGSLIGNSGYATAYAEHEPGV